MRFPEPKFLLILTLGGRTLELQLSIGGGYLPSGVTSCVSYVPFAPLYIKAYTCNILTLFSVLTNTRIIDSRESVRMLCIEGVKAIDIILYASLLPLYLIINH